MSYYNHTFDFNREHIILVNICKERYACKTFRNQAVNKQLKEKNVSSFVVRLRCVRVC